MKLYRSLKPHSVTIGLELTLESETQTLAAHHDDVAKFLYGLIVAKIGRENTMKSSLGCLTIKFLTSPTIALRHT